MGRLCAFVFASVFAAQVGSSALAQPPASADVPPPPEQQVPFPPPMLPPTGAPALPVEFLPSVRPGPFVYGEYLLVQPRRDGLDLGFLGSSSAGSIDGVGESLHYQLANGFRVGGGYRLPADNWDISASFAYFHSKFQKTVDAPDGSFVFPALGLYGANATFADGDAGISYSVTDVELGRTFTPSECFSVRFFGGGRFARIDQSLKAIYSGGDLGTSTDYVNSPAQFTGGGLTAGGEATWKVWQGLGLYGKARFSLLSGQADTRLAETVGGTSYVDFRDSTVVVIPVGELGAGVSFQGQHVFMSAGYDLADWFNMVNGVTQPHFNRPGEITRVRGDLTFEGLSVKFGFVY